ncbi:Alpha/Beta hydrolase protein [Gymnopilus junonius]|uniref:Alpha/Beta hydrolase protein n=1 Tax=Gymnopilus junonius TaxID=109634 RepID=A0A9P5NYF6_GYMJU|nr:Alpha/Beta hydrolase protein [Gymnopilus junonius]
MIYDKNPPYPHYDHLPFAKEPYKSIYVFYRLFTTLALVPVWIICYAIVPRHYRPRASWNLRQVVNVNFTRRIYKVTEVAGVTWGTRDPTLAADEKTLRETRFKWVKPLPEKYRTGIVKDHVPFTDVGCFVWPKHSYSDMSSGKAFTDSGDSRDLTPSSEGDLEAGNDKIPLIGIFMHGGGYCHMSAHESSRTSRIPRNLIERKIFHEVYSVEYRLLQHAPFPAVVIDAAAVYAHVVERYKIKNSRWKLILIGDSSGGNLVLSLARWLRDEGHLPLPDGLLLLSPSCDTSHSLPETLSSYIPRPNSFSDYLVDTPEPRALLQRTFLGFKYRPASEPPDIEEERRLMEVIHSEYVSPCSPIVLKRWGHDLKQDPEGEHEAHFVRHIFRRLPTDLRNTRSPETLNKVVAAATVSLQQDNPYHKSCRFPKLFGDFSRTLVVCGDAERLVREVRSLISAMRSDGIDLQVHWAKDACHDPLILSELWWDRQVLEECWRAIENWAKGFEEVRVVKACGSSNNNASLSAGSASSSDAVAVSQ